MAGAGACVGRCVEDAASFTFPDSLPASDASVRRASEAVSCTGKKIDGADSDVLVASIWAIHNAAVTSATIAAADTAGTIPSALSPQVCPYTTSHDSTNSRTSVITDIAP